MGSDPFEQRLANLLAVTDGALARLDVEDLLVEMLDRLREILSADTAAILLREPGSTELVARAACGLEEEVRQGVRVPIGAGFAGRIAARREPVILTRVDETTVANPILWEKGIRTMLGVPLLRGDGEVLGVLHVGRLVDEVFEGYDAELLTVAAERVTNALQTRRFAVESAAAGMLERGLLPSRLPSVPGLQFASRYAPADERAIGGDWYDAFVLPSGALWLVTGDVAGHGLPAAVVMGRVKSALRAYALVGDGPAQVLELTDRKVHHFEFGTIVTVICAVAHPPYERFELASAGHLPPILATTDGNRATTVDCAVGPPLGTLPGIRRHSAHVDVPDGGVLFFYTDGLIERRDESLLRGLERLQTAVRADLPELVCRDVMHDQVGGYRTFDDIAMLAVRRVSSVLDDAALGTRFAPEPHAVRAARQLVADAVPHLTGELSRVVQLLVSELATNAVVHARTEFSVRVVTPPGRIRVEVSDGSAVEPVALHPGPRDVHGRGLKFVESLADDWGVEHRPIGKTVWFELLVEAPPLAAERAGAGGSRA